MKHNNKISKKFKEKLINDPIFKFGKGFVIRTEVSGNGIDRVLLQKSEEIGKNILCISLIEA